LPVYIIGLFKKYIRKLIMSAAPAPPAEAPAAVEPPPAPVPPRELILSIVALGETTNPRVGNSSRDWECGRIEGKKVGEFVKAPTNDKIKCAFSLLIINLYKIDSTESIEGLKKKLREGDNSFSINLASGKISELASGEISEDDVPVDSNDYWVKFHIVGDMVYLGLCNSCSIGFFPAGDTSSASCEIAAPFILGKGITKVVEPYVKCNMSDLEAILNRDFNNIRFSLDTGIGEQQAFVSGNLTFVESTIGHELYTVIDEGKLPDGTELAPEIRLQIANEFGRQYDRDYPRGTNISEWRIHRDIKPENILLDPCEGGPICGKYKIRIIDKDDETSLGSLHRRPPVTEEGRPNVESIELNAGTLDYRRKGLGAKTLLMLGVKREDSQIQATLMYIMIEDPLYKQGNIRMPGVGNTPARSYPFTKADCDGNGAYGDGKVPFLSPVLKEVLGYISVCDLLDEKYQSYFKTANAAAATSIQALFRGYSLRKSEAEAPEGVVSAATAAAAVVAGAMLKVAKFSAISAIAAAGPLALAIGAVAGAAAAWAAAGEREIGEDGEAAEERGAAGTSSFEGTEANAAAKAAHVLAQSSPFTYTDVGGSGRRRSVSL
jgi:hypothetical protein